MNRPKARKSGVQRTPESAVEGEVIQFRDNQNRLRYKQYVRSPITGKLITKYVGRKAFDAYKSDVDPNYVPAPSRGRLVKGSEAARARMAELRAMRKGNTLETRERSAVLPSRAKIVKLLRSEGIRPTIAAVDLILKHVKASGAGILNRIIEHCESKSIKSLEVNHVKSALKTNKVPRKRRIFVEDDEE